MRNSIFFIAIGLFVFLTACRSSRQVVQENTHDSTTVEFREVEKVVHVPGDSVKASMMVLPSTASRSGSGASISAPVPELVEGRFIPQKQVLETKRAKLTVELTSSGEIKATAVTKDFDEKVTVLEKTITNSKSSVTVAEIKDNWFQRTWASLKKSVNTILIILAIVAVIATVFKLGFNPISIIKNLLKKS